MRLAKNPFGFEANPENPDLQRRCLALEKCSLSLGKSLKFYSYHEIRRVIVGGPNELTYCIL